MQCPAVETRGAGEVRCAVYAEESTGNTSAYRCLLRLEGGERAVSEIISRMRKMSNGVYAAPEVPAVERALRWQSDRCFVTWPRCGCDFVTFSKGGL